MAMSFCKIFPKDAKVMRRIAGECIGAVAMLASVFAATFVRAESENRPVDLELILAVDVSSSMTETEQRVQRDGYINAFRHPDVVRAIGLGAHGAIAVSYIEWAGPHYKRAVLPRWIIDGQNEAKRFADALANQQIMAEAGTSISGALLHAANLFSQHGPTAQRRVIDISGDGLNNTGPPVVPVRDMLVASGISINGLPITLYRDGSHPHESYGKDYLESYFEHCVIGGPDAFVISINDMSQFEIAIRRKLVREIAGMPARVWRASDRRQTSPVFNCTTIHQFMGR